MAYHSTRSRSSSAGIIHRKMRTLAETGRYKDIWAHQNTIFLPWLGTMATASRFASARAAPGFARRGGGFPPFPPLRFPFPFQFPSPSSPARRRFVGGAWPSSSPSPSPSPPSAFVFLSALSRFPARPLNPLLAPSSPLPSLPGFFSRGGPKPPRRTASGEAYSTTSFRPSRWWLRGFVSAAVACSGVVKSTNAHLRAENTGRGQRKFAGLVRRVGLSEAVMCRA